MVHLIFVFTFLNALNFRSATEFVLLLWIDVVPGVCLREEVNKAVSVSGD